jgi:hypothetical protein
MNSIRYCAAWTECGCLVTCGDSHESIGKAVACIPTAGAYVVAIDAETMRSLSPAEETEFQSAVHGHPGVPPAATLVIAACTEIDSRYAVMTPIRVGRRWTWTTWMCFGTYAEAAVHAREGDKVVRFRSTEWQALRRLVAIAPPSYACEDTNPAKFGNETLIEFVFRLLNTVECDLSSIQRHRQSR